MPTPTMHSPNPGNYQVGKGIVSFKQDGDTEYRDLGNVSSMVITPDLTTLDHFSSRLGVKSKDLSIILEKKSTVKITMDEFTAKNIGLMVLGAVDEMAVGGPEIELFSESSITGALRFVGTNDVGPRQTVDLWNVSFQPSGDFELISDEFNEMECTADVLAATSGPNVGEFGLIKQTNVTDVS